MGRPDHKSSLPSHKNSDNLKICKDQRKQSNFNWLEVQHSTGALWTFRKVTR